MANQIAVRLHCPRGSEFICEADCHIYHYEQAAYAQLSGLRLTWSRCRRGDVVEQLDGLIGPKMTMVRGIA